MGIGGLVRGVIAGLVIGAGVIGFQATDAFAVAGKMTGTPPGATALSGGSVTLVLDEPVDGKTEFTSAVGPNGEVDFPSGVDPNRARNCRYTDDAGKTVTFRCGGYFAMGGGAAAVSGWAASSEQRSGWLFDATMMLGGTTSLGKPDATSTGTGFGTGTSSMGSLNGPTGSLMLRMHVPTKWTGALGDVWMFVRYNAQFNRSGTGGAADVHAPVPGNETFTKLKRGQDIEVGAGKSFHTFDGQYLGVYAGASFQQNKITTTSNEAGPVRTFENEQWKTSVATGAWYQFPLSGVGPGWEHLSAIFGVDFRRVPCMNVTGMSPITTYRGKTDSFWETTPYAGINLAF